MNCHGRECGDMADGCHDTHATLAPFLMDASVGESSYGITHEWGEEYQRYSGVVQAVEDFELNNPSVSIGEERRGKEGEQLSCMLT